MDFNLVDPKIEEDILIRDIKISDFEKVNMLINQVHNIHYNGRPDIYKNSDNLLDKEEFRKMINDEKNIAFLGEIAGEVVAICIITIKTYQENETTYFRKIAYIETFCVDEKYRNQGVGRRIFDASKEKAKSRGLNTLELMVWTFNEQAINFYKELGMKPRSFVMELEI